MNNVLREYQKHRIEFGQKIVRVAQNLARLKGHKTATETLECRAHPECQTLRALADEYEAITQDSPV